MYAKCPCKRKAKKKKNEQINKQTLAALNLKIGLGEN